MFICRNAEGVHVCLLECWGGTCLYVEMLKGFRGKRKVGNPWSRGLGLGPNKVDQSGLKVLHLWHHSQKIWKPKPKKKNFSLLTTRIGKSFVLATPKLGPHKATGKPAVFTQTAWINLALKANWSLVERWNLCMIACRVQTILWHFLAVLGWVVARIGRNCWWLTCVLH